MATQNDQIFCHGKGVCHRLVELLSVGAGEDYFVVFSFCFQGRNASVDRLDFHHHSSESAEWIIVYFAITVVGIITEIVDVDFCQSFLLCTTHDGTIEESFQHLWQYGYDVYSHICLNLIFCKSTKTRANFG